MHGAGIMDQSVVHFCGLHLSFEGSHILGWDKRIIRTMQCEYSGANIASIRWSRRIQSAMESDDCLERGSAAREFQCGRATKTIADD